MNCNGISGRKTVKQLSPVKETADSEKKTLQPSSATLISIMKADWLRSLQAGVNIGLVLNGTLALCTQGCMGFSTSLILALKRMTFNRHLSFLSNLPSEHSFLGIIITG